MTYNPVDYPPVVRDLIRRISVAQYELRQHRGLEGHSSIRVGQALWAPLSDLHTDLINKGGSYALQADHGIRIMGLRVALDVNLSPSEAVLRIEKRL